MQWFAANHRFVVIVVVASFLGTTESLNVCAQSTSRASTRSKVPPLNRVAGRDAFRPRNPHESPTTVVAGGFCLVSLRDQKTWVPGDPKIQIAINDKLYQFAGMRQRDIFAASPEQYLPVLAGDSIVAFAEKGQRASGNLEFGLTYHERLYFFRNAEEQADFQANPERYINADLVDQGNCPVSKIDEQKLVPGLPETVLTLNGLRYFFASAGHRRLFIANPQHYVESTNATFHDLQPRVKGNLDLGFTGYAIKAERETAALEEATLENKESDTKSDYYTRPAVSGYCPVSIQKQGVWVRGKSRFKAAFDGKVYHMAGSDELALFRENPREFLPVLGGDSIVAFAEGSQRVPGSAYQPLLAGGRLFLFANAAEKQKFKDNPELYENADLALSGYCIVTLLEQQREELGSSDFETVFHGLRYRFASQALLEKFLAEPEIYVDQSAVAQ